MKVSREIQTCIFVIKGACQILVHVGEIACSFPMRGIRRRVHIRHLDRTSVALSGEKRTRRFVDPPRIFYIVKHICSALI